MLMSSAARSLKLAMLHADSRVLSPTIKRQVAWNMLYVDDDSIKGDIEVNAEGVIGRLNREAMASRRIEYLNATSNPTDIAITGIHRRARLLESVEQSLELPDIEKRRTDEELDELESLLSQQAPEMLSQTGRGKQAAVAA